MNGKIDYNGILRIERTSYYKTQQCPFNPAMIDCGDWCSQFSEPLLGITGKTELEICHEKILVFDEFKDERKKGEEK